MKPNPPENEAALLLFNDEKHSFDDVIQVLVESKIATYDDIAKASDIAQNVDLNVFAFCFIRVKICRDSPALRLLQ